jgi:hypothetical protein
VKSLHRATQVRLTPRVLKESLSKLAKVDNDFHEWQAIFLTKQTTERHALLKQIFLSSFVSAFGKWEAMPS